MDVARHLSGANFNADDFARKRIDEMNGNAPEQVWVEEHHTQGMRATFIKPLDSVLKENNYFEYTRTDIARKVKPLVWSGEHFTVKKSGLYKICMNINCTHWVEYNGSGISENGLSWHEAVKVAQAHHDAFILSALVDDIAPKLSVQNAAKVLLGVFENPDKNAPKGFDWQAMYNEMTEDHRENLVIGGHPDWPSTLTTALSALVTQGEE
jgi:hypothetical protein